jgi:hypothetical protein
MPKGGCDGHIDAKMRHARAAPPNHSLEQADGSVNLFTEDACSCLLLLPVLLPEMYKPQE